MSKFVLVTRRIPEIGIKMLQEKGYDVEVNPHEEIPTQEQIIKVLKSKPFDAVLSLLTDKIDAKVYDAAPSVKIYSNYATGFNNIDIEEAKKRGIIITNSPGNYAHTIAEQTVALILGLTTRTVEADKFVREGKYHGWEPMKFIGTDLTGKTIGIIGVGHIGEKVAKMLYAGFDCKILYYDVVRNEHIEKEYGAQYFSNVDDVLKQADIITLHVPLLDSTRHLINETRLKMMKKTAFLINTARGAVVDEMSLVKALQEGTIAGAGLDVFEFEPKLSSGLTDLPNVILTPHIASARESARNEMARVAAENIIDFFEGRTPKNVVNK
jgi:glyoxylate reductase